MSMGGALDEMGTLRRLVTEVYPSGVVSIVSDTWDFWKVITEYAATLKDEILARAPNEIGLAKVVFRPDSGDPVLILSGYLDSELACDVQGRLIRSDDGRYVVRRGASEGLLITEAERKGAVECLWDVFGGTTTDKGYRVLNPRVGLIYGDSITLARAQTILDRMARKGYASTNVVFGVGSFSYQYISRDSFGLAMKATSGVVNGERRDLSKDPKTDGGTKKSAVGLLRIELEQGEYVLHDRQTEEQEALGELKEVFRDGKLVRFQTLAEIRARVRGSLDGTRAIAGISGEDNG
jgi:nicotinamide phosphoribosyltransferase